VRRRFWLFAFRSRENEEIEQAMWVKRSPEEMEAVKCKNHFWRIRTAILFGLILVALTALCFGGFEGFRRGRVLVPFDEILQRLPLSLIFGAIGAFLFYKFDRRKPSVVCPQCEATKFRDGVFECACGGRFEDMDEMKWT
jgi:hypothetical protein